MAATPFGIDGFGALSPGLARNRRIARGWRDFRIAQ
jgi:hypothetical protein